jgi:hypothetical protein
LVFLAVKMMMILVGGFNHLEKYESQWEGLSHMGIMDKYGTFSPEQSSK